jgi:hypothetical protein
MATKSSPSIILAWDYPKLDPFDPEVWRPPVEAGEEAGLQGALSWDLPYLSHASGKNSILFLSLSLL